MLQKAFQDREAALLHKEKSVSEGTRSLEERTAAVTTREGRVQGLEGFKVQLDADKAALEQRRLQLDSAEAEVCPQPVSQVTTVWCDHPHPHSCNILQHKYPAPHVREHHGMPAALVFVPDAQVADHD